MIYCVRMHLSKMNLFSHLHVTISLFAIFSFISGSLKIRTKAAAFDVGGPKTATSKRLIQDKLYCGLYCVYVKKCPQF